MNNEERERMKEGGRKRNAAYKARDEVAAAVRKWYEENEDEVGTTMALLNQGYDHFDDPCDLVRHMLEDVFDTYRDRARKEAS